MPPLMFSPSRLIHSWLSVYSKSSGIIMMLVFCRAVFFPRSLGIFARESRCQSQHRSSRAPTTHTPFRCPSSSSEKACRSSLLQCARRYEEQRSAVAAADLFLSSGTRQAFREDRFFFFSSGKKKAFREDRFLLSSTTHRDRRSLVWLDRRRIRVPPRSGFVPARD